MVTLQTLFLCPYGVDLADCRRGLLLGRNIQVSIDVCGGCEGAVAKPDLDLLHGNALPQEKAGAGVPEIVEADLLQAVLFKKLSKMLGHIVGAEELAGLVNANVVKVVPAVGGLEESAVHLLLFLLL